MARRSAPFAFVVLAAIAFVLVSSAAGWRGATRTVAEGAATVLVVCVTLPLLLLGRRAATPGGAAVSGLQEATARPRMPERSAPDTQDPYPSVAFATATLVVRRWRPGEIGVRTDARRVLVDNHHIVSMRREPTELLTARARLRRETVSHSVPDAGALA